MLFRSRLQMHWVVILTGLSSVLFEILFTLAYFTQRERQMDITVIMLFSYYAAILICCIVVSKKIKSQKG